MGSYSSERKAAVIAKTPPPYNQSVYPIFSVLVETAPLSAHAAAEHCHRKDPYPEQIRQRKDEFMQPGQRGAFLHQPQASGPKNTPLLTLN